MTEKTRPLTLIADEDPALLAPACVPIDWRQKQAAYEAKRRLWREMVGTVDARSPSEAVRTSGG